MNGAIHIKLLRIRIFCWVAAVVVLSALLLWGVNWPALKATLTYVYIVSSYHVSPWGVLMLAALMIYVKRHQVRVAMDRAPVPGLVFASAGLFIVALAFFTPQNETFWILRLLTACVGAFVIFFGPASLVPVALLGAYAFTICFPLLVDTYLAAGYAGTAVGPSAWLLRLFGLPIVASGQIFQVPLPSGASLLVAITSACAGPTTMAVFVVIFTLMMLDIPLPWRQAAPLFLFGVAGTWLQNVIRIVIVLGSGYFFGENALWAVHFWVSYLLFPLWYLLFALVYFRLAQPPAPRGA